MRGQAGFFDIDERLKELSAKGDMLERLKGLVDFELGDPHHARERLLLLARGRASSRACGAKNSP